MHRLLSFFKQWTLPSALVIGSFTYLLFTQISCLVGPGQIIGGFLLDTIPNTVFVMLYVTFCKISIADMRPRLWHFLLQVIRTLLSGIVVYGIISVSDQMWHLILTGVFICIICPTAAAAPVITEKLGGSISSLTIYTIIANVFTAIIIPLFFPMIEKAAHLTFFTAFCIILQRIIMVLVTPLCLALLTQYYLPNLVKKIRNQTNLPFYIWSYNLAVVMGLTMKNILHSGLDLKTLMWLIWAPLPICIMLFGIGKYVGKFFGEKIAAGQALGQKNTVVGIWLTITFLNPHASISPCAYVIWQNIINSYQLWKKSKGKDLS